MKLMIVAYEKIGPEHEGLPKIKTYMVSDEQEANIRARKSDLPGHRVLTHATAREGSPTERLVGKITQNTSDQITLEELLLETFLMGTCRNLYHEEALTAERKV